MAEQPHIFFHIHKTGGQTLSGVMARQYPRGSVCHLWIQRSETIKAFLALSDEERDRVRVLTGHMPFGCHRYFPQGARYVTLLRDPVKRFFSEFRHLSDQPEEWAEWRPPATALESVEAYLDYVVSNNLGNVQTRMVGGFVGLEDRPPLAPLPPEALEVAKHNLEHYFAVVGATERFDESLVLMQQVLGWKKSIHYMRRNVREKQQIRTPVSEATMQRLRASVALDTELVAHGARLLDEQIARAGKTLDEPLRRLRLVNARLDWVLRLAHSPVVRGIRAIPGLRQIYDGTGRLVRKLT